MVGSYLFSDELESGRASTSAWMGRGLGEDQGENGRGDDHGNANGESHEAHSLFLLRHHHRLR